MERVLPVLPRIVTRRLPLWRWWLCTDRRRTRSGAEGWATATKPGAVGGTSPQGSFRSPSTVRWSEAADRRTARCHSDLPRFCWTVGRRREPADDPLHFPSLPSFLPLKPAAPTSDNSVGANGSIASPPPTTSALTASVECSSVLKKRKLKMNKHKHRKRRKRDRKKTKV